MCVASSPTDASTSNRDRSLETSRHVCPRRRRARSPPSRRRSAKSSRGRSLRRRSSSARRTEGNTSASPTTCIASLHSGLQPPISRASTARMSASRCKASPTPSVSIAGSYDPSRAADVSWRDEAVDDSLCGPRRMQLVRQHALARTKGHRARLGEGHGDRRRWQRARVGRGRPYGSHRARCTTLTRGHRLTKIDQSAITRGPASCRREKTARLSSGPARAARIREARHAEDEDEQNREEAVPCERLRPRPPPEGWRESRPQQQEQEASPPPAQQRHGPGHAREEDQASLALRLRRRKKDFLEKEKTDHAPRKTWIQSTP